MKELSTKFQNENESKFQLTSGVFFNASSLCNWESQLIIFEAIRRAIGGRESTIRYRELMIGKWLTPPPTPGTFIIQWNRRSIMCNSVITLRAKRKPFCMESIVPPCWHGWWEAWACWPKWLIASHRPLPTCSTRTVWPCGHTTKRPYLSYNLNPYYQITADQTQTST